MIGQGCILLLVLREHLKDFYGLNEVKIEAYSPSESQKIYEKPVHRKPNNKFNPKATVEILKLGDIDPSHMDQEVKKDLIKKYLTFKELMNKIEKDDEEYDEDGNVIAQGPKFNAKEVQNFGMPTVRQQQHTSHNYHNGHQAELQQHQAGQQHGMKNLAVRLQNVPLSSLPNHFLPDNIKSQAASSKPVDQISDAGKDQHCWSSLSYHCDPQVDIWTQRLGCGLWRRERAGVSPLLLRPRAIVRFEECFP